MNNEQILEAIKGMTVLELNDLVKAIEEEFGVTAAAPMAMAAGGGAEHRSPPAGAPLPADPPGLEGPGIGRLPALREA